MYFHFQKSIRDRGRRGLIGTLIFTACFSAMDWYLMHQPVEVGRLVGVWFAGFLVLFISMVTLWCLVMLFSKARWEVSVTADEIHWQVPEHMDETGFRVPLKDVSKLIRIRSEAGHFATRYQLVTQGDEVIELHNNLSGMDMQAFIDCLEGLGIPCQDQVE